MVPKPSCFACTGSSKIRTPPVWLKSKVQKPWDHASSKWRHSRYPASHQWPWKWPLAEFQCGLWTARQCPIHLGHSSMFCIHQHGNNNGRANTLAKTWSVEHQLCKPVCLAAVPTTFRISSAKNLWPVSIVTGYDGFDPAKRMHLHQESISTVPRWASCCSWTWDSTHLHFARPKWPSMSVSEGQEANSCQCAITTWTKSWVTTNRQRHDILPACVLKSHVLHVLAICFTSQSHKKHPKKGWTKTNRPTDMF